MREWNASIKRRWPNRSICTTCSRITVIRSNAATLPKGEECQHEDYVEQHLDHVEDVKIFDELSKGGIVQVRKSQFLAAVAGAAALQRPPPARSVGVTSQSLNRTRKVGPNLWEKEVSTQARTALSECNN